MQAIQPSKNTRHKFAHHIWAYSPNVKNALCLIDPKHIARQEAEYKKEHGTDYFIVRDKSQVFVYTEDCFNAAIEAAYEADRLVANLRFLKGETFDRTRTALLSSPEVQRVLHKAYPQKYPATPDKGV